MRPARLLIAWLATSPLAAQGLASPIVIRPFAASRPISAWSDQWHYFLDLPQAVNVASDGAFDIDFSTSPGSPGISGCLTVLLNGEPMDSRVVQGTDGRVVRWQVSLPKVKLKPGFNDVLLSAVKDRADEPCRAGDDVGEWLELRKSSRLTITLVKPATVPLGSYPYPYLNWLPQPAACAPISLRRPLAPGDVAAALDLAGSWGRRLPDQPLLVRVTTLPPKRAAVHLGRAGDFHFASGSDPVQVRGGSLYVSGRDASALDAAVRTLSDPEIVGQLHGFTARVATCGPNSASPAERLGVSRFSELGHPTFNLSGAGEQSTTIVVRRPVGAELGRGGTLRLQFLHSATLLRGSWLSVSINDTPLGKVDLTANNSNDGELTCPIPVAVADRGEWDVRIAVRHELGADGCGKSVDDIAWTTILGTSELELRDGSLPATPYLEGFPYFRAAKGLLPGPLIISVDPGASDAELTVAATLAARAAQTNRDLPSWTVTSDRITGNEDIVIGSVKDVGRLAPILGRLFIVPSRDGVPKATRPLPNLATTLARAVILQAVPNRAGRASYVLLAPSNRMLYRFAAFLATGQNALRLHGQVAVFSEKGRLFTFDTVSTADRSALELAELHRYKPEMELCMGLVLAGLAGFGVFIGSRFVKAKPAKS